MARWVEGCACMALLGSLGGRALMSSVEWCWRKIHSKLLHAGLTSASMLGNCNVLTLMLHHLTTVYKWDYGTFHPPSILQTRMRSHPVGIDAWLLVPLFVYFHTSCVLITKALARLHRCAGSSEPSLVAYVIRTITSWAGSNYVTDNY